MACGPVSNSRRSARPAPAPTAMRGAPRDQPVAPWIDEGQPITITDAELSGAWGLSLDWSDGHSTGIYAWEKLRSWVDAGEVGAVADQRSDPES